MAVYLAVTAMGWTRSPNWDELWLLGHAAMPLGTQLDAIRRDLAHPPLIYMLFRGWLFVFGHTEMAAKMLVVSLNVPSLILFTWLAHRLTSHWRLAAVLFSAIYLQIGSVPNLIRGYGLLFLCTVVAIAFWNEWRSSGRPRWLFGWVLAMTVSVYTHYFGFLLLAGFVAANFAVGRRRWTFVAASSIPVALIVPWLLYAQRAYTPQENLVPPSLQWATARGMSRGVKDLPVAFWAQFEAGRDPFAAREVLDRKSVWRGLRYAVWGLHIALLLLLLRRWRTLLRPSGDEHEEIRVFWALVLITGVPVVLLVAASLVVAPMFHPRFLAAALPAYWLLMAVVIQLSGKPGRVLCYLGVVPIVAIATLITSAQDLGASELRTRTREVASAFEEGDAILGDSLVGVHVSWEWRAVLGRVEPVTVVRVGEPGDIPYRERCRQNVLSYHDIEAVRTDDVRRVWYFSSSRRECQKATEFFGTRGFRPSGRFPDDAFASGSRFGVKEFIRPGDVSKDLEPRNDLPGR